MITCTNCAHANPDGATQCEACYTPLPAVKVCPECNAPVVAGAAFCGQCGYAFEPPSPENTSIPATAIPATLVEQAMPAHAETELPPPSPANSPVPVVASAVPTPPVPASTVGSAALPLVEAQPAAVAATSSKTQLQQSSARLLHVQTDTLLEIPANLSVVHIGKPNDRIPPDIDVSGFADSDIVSRIHADVRIEGDAYYLEDTGSSNGTYVNNMPLPPGNRHRLRVGDRISLGKGDRVSFLFQVSS